MLSFQRGCPKCRFKLCGSFDGRQLRGGRGQGHWRGGIQARGGPDAKENEDKGRDRQENCESGA